MKTKARALIVYSLAARLTDDPREAIALTRHAFNSARKQARNLLRPQRAACVLKNCIRLHSSISRLGYDEALVGQPIG